MRRYLCLFLILLLVKISFTQNQANIWYFSEHCGLDFNSGTPEVIYNGQTNFNLGCATISDSLGNLLFYSDYRKVYNKNHEVMMNGDDLIDAGTFGRTMIKWPGQDDMYYVFTALHPQIYTGLYYSIVDLNLENGLGAIVEKDTPVESASDAADRIAIVKKENTENVWAITRKYTNDAIAAYLVDETGFNANPVLSEMPDREGNTWDWGFLKISYDKKFLFSSYASDKEIEICSFNASSGTSEYMYSLIMPGGIPWVISGLEFSPDSKYFYVSYNKSLDTNEIYQFDMQFIANKDLLNSSAILVGTGAASCMQLARDGKIYCSSPPVPTRYISVIHNPWIRGEGCNYESNALFMYPGEVTLSLPNILLDYLYRFEWEADKYCQNSPVHFIPNFIPTPDSVRWFFDEFAPGNYSDELSPTYAFQFPGIHEVEVDIWYPTGRFEHTSREIEIFPVPEPDLGPDTIICEGNTVTLFANCTADFYAWNTGQIDVSQITVSDSGNYWVRALFNETGCIGYDTIHVGFHPATIIDETNLFIKPTTCDGASGSITGLDALGPMPFEFQWEDLSGNDYGTDIDVFNLPAGQYLLTVTDANGCESSSATYQVDDAGDLQVTRVQPAAPHCGKPDGQITVSAFSPSGASLQYSIDDGDSYQADSIFTGLVDSSYVVRVKDENNCEGLYADNPVMLEDIPGPQVTQVNVTDETDFLGNGEIEIIASGSTAVIYYSIDGGSTWQSNNGTFNDLESRIYDCMILDQNGCDTSFSVEIQNIILTYLQTITDPAYFCQGNAATVPVVVENFNAVASFHLKLSYNADNLQCDGFTNIHPQLLDSLTGWVDQDQGVIYLSWNSPVPVTFTQPETIAELVFTTNNPGQGDLAWYTGTTESWFTNINGSTIPAEFHTGEVKIFHSPQIILSPSKTVCEGQMVSIMSIASFENPPIHYQWTYPDGQVYDTDPFFLSITQADAGDYTLLATDAMECTDQQTIQLIISENPVAAFHGTDTLLLHPGEYLDAGAGLASYLWNTGDTTESIAINAEGRYSVEIKSPAGCTGSESIYIKLTSDEILASNIFIPNAFSPNGDGVNDIFEAIATDDYISKFNMLIFDRWGGEIFESDDILHGWDGTKNGVLCPNNVYIYKITFSIYPSFGVYPYQVRYGTVMLVR